MKMFGHWRIFEKNYRSNRGAIYGVVADKKKNKGFNFLKESQYFENLLLCRWISKSWWWHANGYIKWATSRRQINAREAKNRK